MALYDEAVKLAKSYVGPVGQQFIDRQLSAHLNVKPADLNPMSLPELSKWCFFSGRLLIGDKQAEEFKTKVMALK